MSGGVPPTSRAGRSRRNIETDLDAVSDLRERFTGHESRPPRSIRVDPLPSAVAVIGDCDGILYTTKRDGKTERYIHEFALKDRPKLCIAPDGRQILLIGGRYVFTERGIVDLSDKKNLPRSLRGLR